MLKFQYDGREKIRIKTVNRIKNERKKIIKEEESNKKIKGFNTKYKNSRSLEKTDREKRRIKMIEDGKKSIELVKKRQRLNIENFIEEQINQDLMMKTHLAKDLLRAGGYPARSKICLRVLTHFLFVERNYGSVIGLDDELHDSRRTSVLL